MRGMQSLRFKFSDKQDDFEMYNYSCPAAAILKVILGTVLYISIASVTVDDCASMQGRHNYCMDYYYAYIILYFGGRSPLYLCPGFLWPILVNGSTWPCN